MEEQTAVNPTESAPVEVTPEVVNTPESTTEQAQTIQTSNETMPTQTQGNVYEAVDELGVPWKNRAAEWKRKSEETIERMPSLIDDAVKNSFQQYGKPQEQKYTIEQLEQFAQNQPEHRPWVEQEKVKIIKEDVIKEVEGKFRTEATQKEFQSKRNQSLVYVMENYPDLFLKNNKGQVVGINSNNPMALQVDAFMKEPRFANDPEGVIAAAEMSYARMMRANQGQVQQKEAKLKAEVKHLQKQTLVESGSKSNVQAVPAHRAALEKAKQTGNLKDVAAALKAMAEHKKASMEK
jgi:hypothetical protein